MQQGCASLICLRDEAVYSSLLLCGCTWGHILPLKGYKLTFSSRNVPFRKKQGKLCHYSDMCEPPVLSLSWYATSNLSDDGFPGHLPGSLHCFPFGNRNHFLLHFKTERGEEIGFFKE